VIVYVVRKYSCSNSSATLLSRFFFVYEFLRRKQKHFSDPGRKIYYLFTSIIQTSRAAGNFSCNFISKELSGSQKLAMLDTGEFSQIKVSTSQSVTTKTLIGDQVFIETEFRPRQVIMCCLLLLTIAECDFIEFPLSHNNLRETDDNCLSSYPTAPLSVIPPPTAAGFSRSMM
jgi:hypothetical protein